MLLNAKTVAERNLKEKKLEILGSFGIRKCYEEFSFCKLIMACQKCTHSIRVDNDEIY